MNTAELEALRNTVMTLSEREKARLASDLVASLDGPAEKDAAEAWDIELCRRINEIESGQADVLDIDEVLARARSRTGI